MKLTEKQKQDYLASPNYCPYCGSTEIDAREFDGQFEQVQCLDCEKEWVDRYAIVQILCNDEEE